jgi:hypothetical protein
MDSSTLPVFEVSTAASLALVGGMVFRYQRRQNHAHAMGGPITPAKSYWLAFAVFAWFFLPLCLALPSRHHPAVETMLLTFAASMWIRGILEMLLLYKWKLWRPPMGIGHDLFCQVVLLAQAWWYRDALAGLVGQDAVLASFCAWIFVSLCFEIYYAAAFYGAVQGMTTGDDGIWFADDDPRFQRILAVTRFGNVVLTASLGVILGAYVALRP